MIESKVEATRFVVGGRELKKGRRKRIVMVMCRSFGRWCMVVMKVTGGKLASNFFI